MSLVLGFAGKCNNKPAFVRILWLTATIVIEIHGEGFRTRFFRDEHGFHLIKHESSQNIPWTKTAKCAAEICQENDYSI